MISVPYEVKKALRDGMLRKNYRFVVLNDDGTPDEEIGTIDNDYLVSESVNIDERMCSGDTLKFGLCEGSSLEFQYFNKPNITGRRVQVFVDVEYEKVITEYVWETQASFNNYYTISDMDGDCRLYSERSNAWEFVYVRENGVWTQVYPTPSASGTIIELGDVTGRTLMVNLDVMPAPSAQLQLLIPHTRSQILTYSIPMGFFDVKKCSRQASTGIMKVTAYNKLQSDYLDAKANDLLIEAYNNQDSYSPSTIEKLLDSVLGYYKIDTHYNVRATAHHDISSQVASLFNTCEKIDVKVYEEHGQVAESHYLHGICPYIRMTFGTSNNMYKFAKFDYEYIGSLVEDAGMPFSNYYIESTGESFLGWLGTSGSNTSEIRGGVYKFSYNDSVSSHNVADFIRSTIPSAYYWDIESNTTPAGTSYQFAFYAPIYWVMDDNPTYDWTAVSHDVFMTIRNITENIRGHFNLSSNFSVWRQKDSVASDMDVGAEIEDWPDVTLRDLQSAIYEIQCQFGQLDRKTDMFTGVDLNYGGLYPADTLYPANDLYPGGAVMSANKAMYSQLWADEGNVHKWRNLVITYKGLDEEQNEVDIVHERVIDANGTDDYNMSDNWLFRNLIWTEEQIDDYADAMIAKMQDITWFPFEMWCAGLPYLETGDEIEIPLNGESYTSYVLQRQLKGIQNLQDTYINGTLDIF